MSKTSELKIKRSISYGKQLKCFQMVQNGFFVLTSIIFFQSGPLCHSPPTQFKLKQYFLTASTGNRKIRQFREYMDKRENSPCLSAKWKEDTGLPLRINAQSMALTCFPWLLWTYCSFVQPCLASSVKGKEESLGPGEWV